MPIVCARESRIGDVVMKKGKARRLRAQGAMTRHSGCLNVSEGLNAEHVITFRIFDAGLLRKSFALYRSKLSVSCMLAIAIYHCSLV